MQRERGPLQVHAGPALAGVSSFGITGTNAHVVLEEAPPRKTAPANPGGCCLLLLSAHSEKALQASARSYLDYLTQGGLTQSANVPEIGAVCFNAAVRRTHHDHRLAVVGRSREELTARLQAFVEGESRPGLIAGERRENPGKTVFVFPGQGSQWFGMGRRLIQQEPQQEPAFRAKLEQCDRAFGKYVSWSLLDELVADESTSKLNQIDVIQPALFAIQVSLAALWMDWGVKPDAVVGHSMGEVAAAHVAGILSLDDAACIICQRSRLLRSASGKGAMLLVDLSLEEAAQAIAGLEDRVSIAVSNSVRSTVLSGDPDALKQCAADLESRQIFCRWIKVDVASHSPQMDPLRPALLEALGGIEPRDAEIPLYSTVTGTVAGSASSGAPGNAVRMDSAYWVDNLRKPVLFADAVQALCRDGHDIFLEISPHPILLPAIQQGFQHANHSGLALPSLRRDEDEQAVLLESFGGLYTHGYPVDWTRIYPSPAPHVSLPAYPWQRERYWFEEQDSRGRLPAAAPQAGSPATAGLADLLYTIRWERAPLARSTAKPQAGSWIVFADRRGVAQSVAAQLASSGEPCVLVTPGPAYRERAQGIFELRPEQAEDYQELLSTVRESGPCRGVLHLWSLDSTGSAETTSDPWGGVLPLVQALARAEWGASGNNAPRLYLITSGAQSPTPGDALSTVSAGTLLGLGRVIANEHPEFRCTRVDLSGAAAKTEIAGLCDELRAGSEEEEICLRGGARYGARLQKWALPQTISAARDWAEGSYLITGGFGSLGLEVGKWLAAQGARNLILTGRRGASVSAQAALAELRGSGVQVLEVPADISVTDQVDKLFAQIGEQMPPLRGIFHAAGVLNDGILLQLDRERFASVLAPKVSGAWNLHRATLQAPVDLFVLFSSIAAVLGSPGQANYAAGNAFLDSLARYRQALGMPALSINWGPWSEIGLAAASDERSGGLRGVASLTPQMGMQAFARLIAQPEPNVAVMPFRLEPWAEAYPKSAASPFFSAFRSQAPPQTEAAATSLRASLLAVEPGQRRRALFTTHLQEQAAKVLKSAPSRIDLNKPLKTMGLDSLLALELRARFEKSLGLTLPGTLVWNYPTVSLLAAHLAERMGIQLEEAEPRPTSAPPADASPVELGFENPEEMDRLLAEIEGLSEEEIQKTLSGR